MRRIGSVRQFGVCAFLAVVSGGLWACSEEPTGVAGPENQLLAAKGSGGGGSGPKVDSVDPPSVPQATTRDFRVLGSGYDKTSKVRVLLNRKEIDQVRTNSTRFVSSTELIANVTIDTDAPLDFYDVEATAAGGRKKGIGVEKVEVTPGEVTALVTDPSPDDSEPGVYSDGGSGSGIYAPGDGVTARVDLKVLCPRQIRLVLPSRPAPISILDGAAIPMCNDPGAVFLRLADLTEKGACEAGTCWPSEPSYTTNKNGKVRPTGAFASNLDYFFRVPDDTRYNFVWTDGAIALETVKGLPVKHVTASNAHLYHGDMSPVCDVLGAEGTGTVATQVDLDLCPQPADPSDPRNVRVNFSLALDVRVVEGNTWPE